MSPLGSSPTTMGGVYEGRPLTRTSWIEMTEQGKALFEVTLTITESTPSGNSYLKY